MGDWVSHLRDLLTAPTRAKEETRLGLLAVIMAKPGNQAYLSRRSGLSPAAVSDAVKELADAGTIRTRREGRDVFVEMAPTTGVAVGIELGYQHSAIVARRVDQPYDQARVKVCETGAARGSNIWLDELASGISETVSEVGEHGDDIATIGLGIPRMIDPRSGGLTPPRLPPWDTSENPAVLLAERLRTPGWSPRVLLDNDATLAALAESTYAFPDAETLVNIKVSTGVGAGIIIGGTVFRGRRGVAGEIGHMVAEPGGRFCSCGGRGCLETLIGADALVEQARTVLGHRAYTPPSLGELVARANQGNLVCQRVLRDAAAHLGFAIGNLCNVLNPQVVVIGGAFGRPDAASLILEPCREAIKQSAMKAAYETEFQVVTSQVPHASAHGALVLGLQGTTY
jgi:predicted NBD/HSP70 family sugar kinase